MFTLSQMTQLMDNLVGIRIEKLLILYIKLNLKKKELYKSPIDAPAFFALYL